MYFNEIKKRNKSLIIHILLFLMLFISSSKFFHLVAFAFNLNLFTISYTLDLLLYLKKLSFYSNPWKVVLLNKEFWEESFFFQHFIDVVPLSSYSAYFQWEFSVNLNCFCVCSGLMDYFSLPAFSIFPLSLVLNSLTMACLRLFFLVVKSWLIVTFTCHLHSVNFYFTYLFFSFRLKFILILLYIFSFRFPIFLFIIGIFFFVLEHG